MKKSMVGLLLAGILSVGCAGAMELAGSGAAVPIVIPADTTHYNRVAAADLADYIEKMSGARPEIMEGKPDPLPARAVWVGYQPELKKVFPDLDFDFQYPEEILIAATDNHLAIVGRDRWMEGHTEFITRRKNLPGRQMEYGTVNAVYTFLRDYLGVRWLIPGPLGEDVPDRKQIAFEPFEYRYHPQIRARSTLFAPWTPDAGRSNANFQEWLRRQRLWLDSLDMHGGHAFNTWWGNYSEEHPDYFALQPDGTRSGYPNPHNVKICSANPAVWDRWLQEVEETLESDPTRRVFSAASNDGWSAGHCVCEACRAWDHPQAELLTYTWQGVSQDYVALSDREVTFANTLARKLRERYPDKDYYVQVMAYGLSRPAPVGVAPDDNVIISSVANFHLRSPQARAEHMGQFGDWGAKTKHLMWRPNLGNAYGWQWGMPDIALQQAGEDFRFVADNGAIGLFFDMIWDHWGNQGPHYYLIAHLAWNPYIDADALMRDYHQRMYGPAAEIMQGYWEELERIRMEAVEASQSPLGIGDIYSPEVEARLEDMLDQAAQALADAPEKYRERLAFTRAGWEYAQVVIAIRRAMDRFEMSGNKDQEAAAEVLAYWDQVQKEMRGTIPDEVVSFMRVFNQPGNRRMGGLHPTMPSSRGALLLLEASREDWEKTGYTDARATGWELLFEDNFERDTLGDDWTVLDGAWRVEKGHLIGSGELVSARGFPGDHPPGFIRLEFDVTSHVEAVDLGGGPGGGDTAVSDFSSMLHVPAPELFEGNAWRNSYFFQFGGRLNTVNRIARHGQTLMSDPNPRMLITPGEQHRLVVENDQGELRFWVNEQLIMATSEDGSRIGHNYDRVGFYFFTTAKVNNIRVYVKRLPDDLDLD